MDIRTGTLINLAVESRLVSIICRQFDEYPAALRAVHLQTIVSK